MTQIVVKLLSSSSSKNENQKTISPSKLNTTSTTDITKKLTKTTKDKLNRTLSNEEQKATTSTSSLTKLSNSNNNTITPNILSNINSSSSSTLRNKENGELRNRAKSFTPLNLTSGTQLAAVLAEHKKLIAIGFQPDHEMIQKTIEVGTSKINNSPVNMNVSSSTTNSLTNNSNKLNINTKNKINQNKYSSSLNDDISVKLDENNNELIKIEDRNSRQSYLRNPYLSQTLDSSNRISLSDSNRNSDLPDSMTELLNRSAKAREPLVNKPINKQYAFKRKTQIKADSFDSGTSSPTTNRSTASLTNTKKLTSTINKGRSDFARTYALNSKSPTSNDRSISKTNKTGLVRSNTLTDIDIDNLTGNKSSSSAAASNFLNISNTSNSSNSNSFNKTNSIIHRNPRSDYAKTSKYTTLLKSENDEFKYKYKTRVPKNRLLDEEKSSSLDTELIKNDRIKKIQLQKQYSLESNLTPIKNDDRKLKKSNTSGLYLATNKTVTFNKLEDDDSDLTDKEEEQPKPIPNKIFDNADQILFKQKIEQRMNIYKNKGNLKLCIGKQGSEHEFKWPRDVCWVKFTLKSKLLSEQILLVTDTGHSQVSCFDTQGKFINSFGHTNGNEESKLSSPISACCLPDGLIVISDSDLNCLKFYDSECNFLKSIGNKNNQTIGTKLNLNASRSSFNFIQNLTETKSSASIKPGEFNSCYGITYEPNQNEIYVCDKDNQRVQIFDSNGNFKRFLNSNKSSTRLNLDNQLIFKNPNFIHSNGQFLIISDTSNHTIHRYNIKTGNTLILGGEGTSESKFKYPRGVAIDEFNFSIVADSGNNRIQIFKPDGSFHHSFGSYGSGEGPYFKGIEGLSVDELGDIYVCDRENNRIQVF